MNKEELFVILISVIGLSVWILIGFKNRNQVNRSVIPTAQLAVIAKHLEEMIHRHESIESNLHDMRLGTIHEEELQELRQSIYVINRDFLKLLHIVLDVFLNPNQEGHP